MRYVAFNGKMNFEGEYKIMWMEEIVSDLTSDYLPEFACRKQEQPHNLSIKLLGPWVEDRTGWLLQQGRTVLEHGCKPRKVMAYSEVKMTEMFRY
jgi:hypothetical protein